MIHVVHTVHAVRPILFSTTNRTTGANVQEAKKGIRKCRTR